MVRFKEYKRRDKIYLSVVEHEETKVKMGSAFIVYPSLLRLEFKQIPTVPHSDFVLSLTTTVTDRTLDDIYLLHSASHANSCTATFPLLRQKIISSEVR